MLGLDCLRDLPLLMVYHPRSAFPPPGTLSFYGLLSDSGFRYSGVAREVLYPLTLLDNQVQAIYAQRGIPALFLVFFAFLLVLFLGSLPQLSSLLHTYLHCSVEVALPELTVLLSSAICTGCILVLSLVPSLFPGTCLPFLRYTAGRMWHSLDLSHDHLQLTFPIDYLVLCS